MMVNVFPMLNLLFLTLLSMLVGRTVLDLISMLRFYCIRVPFHSGTSEHYTFPCLSVRPKGLRLIRMQCNSTIPPYWFLIGSNMILPKVPLKFGWSRILFLVVMRIEMEAKSSASRRSQSTNLLPKNHLFMFNEILLTFQLYVKGRSYLWIEILG